MSDSKLIVDQNNSLTNQHNKKKETFGVNPNNKEKSNTNKIVVSAIAAVMAVTAIAVPVVINVNKNNIKDYTVTISTEITGEQHSLNLKKGSVIGDIKTPQINGYVFMGYYSSADFDPNNALSPNTQITEDMSVYLHYVIIDYTLKDIPEGVIVKDVYGNQLTSDTILHYGDKISIDYNLKDGYHLQDFSVFGVELTNEQDDAGNYLYLVTGTGNENQQDTNITIVFEQAINIYNITYYNEDGTLLGEERVSHGEFASNSAVKTPTKQEDDFYFYVFAGWVNGDNELVDLNSTTITGNTSLTASYTAYRLKLDITVNANDASQVIIYKVNDEGSQTEVSLTDTLRVGDKLIVKTLSTEGYEAKVEVEGASLQNGYYVVSDDVTINYSEECAFLSFAEVNGGYEITGFADGLTIDKVPTNIVLPSTYNNKSVVSVASRALCEDWENWSEENMEFWNKVGEKVVGLTVPASITHFGESSLQGLMQLSSFYYQGSIKQWCELSLEDDGQGFVPSNANLWIDGQLFEGSEGRLQEYNLVIPEGVTYIRKNAFAFRNITSVSLPNTLQTIEAMAFYATRLTNIIIPDSVLTVGYDAFHSCPLEYIYIGSGLQDVSGVLTMDSTQGTGEFQTSAGSVLKELKVNPNNKIYTSQDYSGNEVNCIIDKTSKTLIQGCSSSIIPNDGSVTIIGDYAFLAINIKNIKIPSTITSIGSRSFFRAGLEGELVVPASVTSIDSQAFYATNITKALIGVEEGEWQNCNISFGILDYCSNLKSIIIGKFVTNMRMFVESYRYGEKINPIEEIKVDVNNPVYTSQNHLGEELNCIINKKTKTIIQGCSNSVIPEDGSVTIIGDQAFVGCSFENLVMPETITKIKSGAFANCVIQTFNTNTELTTCHNESFYNSVINKFVVNSNYMSIRFIRVKIKDLIIKNNIIQCRGDWDPEIENIVYEAYYNLHEMFQCFISNRVINTYNIKQIKLNRVAVDDYKNGTYKNYEDGEVGYQSDRIDSLLAELEQNYSQTEDGDFYVFTKLQQD